MMLSIFSFSYLPFIFTDKLSAWIFCPFFIVWPIIGLFVLLLNCKILHIWGTYPLSDYVLQILPPSL